MTRIAPIIVSFSLLAFAGGAAAAGDNKSQGASNAQHSATQSQAMSAKRLIGTDVVDAQGRDMGEIKEVVLDLRSGRVHAAVVEFGGFLGVGDKQYAFPVSDLKPAREADKLALDVNKEKLEQQQGFDKNRWPAMGDDYWGRIGGKAAAGGTRAQGGKANLHRASELMGRNVQDRNGQEVGEITDVLLSADRGRIEHIVIDRNEGAATRVAPSKLSFGTGDKLMVDMPAAKARQGSAAGGSTVGAKTFAELDTNNDGRLSREEWQAGQAK